MLVVMYLVKCNGTFFCKHFALASLVASVIDELVNLKCDSVWHSLNIINMAILEPCMSSEDPYRKIHPSYYLSMAAG